MRAVLATPAVDAVADVVGGGRAALLAARAVQAGARAVEPLGLGLGLLLEAGVPQRARIAAVALGAQARVRAVQVEAVARQARHCTRRALVHVHFAARTRPSYRKPPKYVTTETQNVGKLTQGICNVICYSLT